MKNFLTQFCKILHFKLKRPLDLKKYPRKEHSIFNKRDQELTQILLFVTPDLELLFGKN